MSLPGAARGSQAGKRCYGFARSTTKYAPNRMVLKLQATPGRAQGALLGATPVNGSAHK